MKLTCDLCGGELKAKSVGAVCSYCGIEYGQDRLREKMSAIPPEQKAVPPVKKEISHEVVSDTDQKKFKLLWKIFGIICVVCFAGVLMASTPQQEAAVYIACVAATLLDFAILMPRKKKEGKRR